LADATRSKATISNIT